MKNVTVLVVAGCLAAGVACAQTRPATSAPTVTTTPGAPVPATPNSNPSTGTVPGAGVVDRNAGVTAAAGDRNQAVATTDANAPQPAKGANSFSTGEARRRIEGHGFSNVSDLKKDRDGIWRGTAAKDGANTAVWLDYKGNVGRQ